MNIDPRNPMFHDKDKAREYFEAQRWPDGKPFCCHCGSFNVHRLEGKSHRAGLLQCNDCLGAFTVTTKSVMERSHVPLSKWALAFPSRSATFPLMWWLGLVTSRPCCPCTVWAAY